MTSPPELKSANPKRTIRLDEVERMGVEEIPYIISESIYNVCIFFPPKLLKDPAACIERLERELDRYIASKTTN